MADLFGVRLVAATIARMSRTCAGRAQGFADTVGALVKAAAVKHLDETGFRIGGRTQWLHIACTAWLTFYRISPQRGSLLLWASSCMTTGGFKFRNEHHLCSGSRRGECRGNDGS